MDKLNTRNGIMIIDDDIGMMDAMSVILKKYDITVSPFTEPIAALEELKNNSYDILIINYLLNPIRGDEIVQMVRNFNKEIYIILMSAHKELAPSVDIMRNLDVHAYFEKSSRLDQLILLIESGFKYVQSIAHVKLMSATIELHSVELATILKNTVGAKDHFTKEHSDRVALYTDLFGKYLNVSEEELNILNISAQFHDIGKIGISDNILLKAGKLTKEEYEHVKLHPVIGTNILSSSSIFKNALPIIRGHHECYDGSGYPDGLARDSIPFLARILALCDSFDAITAKRPYKEATGLIYGLEEIKKFSGTQFDPSLVDKFIDCISKNKDKAEEILKIQKENT